MSLCRAGAAAATVLAAACGYAMAKFAFRGRELIFSVVLGGVLGPSTALAIPLYLLMAKIHLVGSYWSVLLPSMVSPFGVYLSRIPAAAVPDLALLGLSRPRRPGSHLLAPAASPELLAEAARRLTLAPGQLR